MRLFNHPEASTMTMLKSYLILYFMSHLASEALPFSKGGTIIDYSLLTECEKNLQKDCIEIYSDEKFLLPQKDGKCETSKLYDCIMREVKKTPCMAKDIGTVAYIKDFAKRLRNVYINKGKCMDQNGRKEVLELFKPPDFGYNNTTAHIQEPPHFETSGSSGHWTSDDTEPEEAEVGHDASGHGEGG